MSSVMRPTPLLVASSLGDVLNVQSLTATCSKDAVHIRLLDIKNARTFRAEEERIRDLLHWVSGILFFTRDLRVLEVNAEWLLKLGELSGRHLPCVLNFQLKYPEKTVEKATMAQIDKKLPGVFKKGSWPRLTFTMRDGLAELLADIHGITKGAALQRLKSKHAREPKVSPMLAETTAAD